MNGRKGRELRCLERRGSRATSAAAVDREVQLRGGAKRGRGSGWEREERNEEENPNSCLYTSNDISGREGLSRLRDGPVLFEADLMMCPSR